jgi:predicted peroxiredoxin
MCFHDALGLVFNCIMTALSLLRAGADVTMYFGSKGIYAVHKKKMHELKCEPEEITEKMLKKMDEMNLPTIEDQLTMFIMEGGLVLACPLAKEQFEIKDEDLFEDVAVADPDTYYTDIVMQADMNLTF